jgi:hypothetical protein
VLVPVAIGAEDDLVTLAEPETVLDVPETLDAVLEATLLGADVMVDDPPAAAVQTESR